MSSAFLITISEIRSSVGDIPSQLYTTDIGQEGHWYVDGMGALAEDNTGTVLITADLKRYRRAFDGVVNVKWFGAKGDYDPTTNTGTDDTLAIQKAMDTAINWFIPNSAKNYLISGTITIKADGICESVVYTTSGFNSVAFNFSNITYGIKRTIRGLNVKAKSARVSGSVGIKIESPSVVLERCFVQAMDYGIQVCCFSIALMNCSAFQCNTNLSAFAPQSSQEINDLKIIGGNYDSGINYSCRIGDPTFGTSIPAGNPMGTSILVLGASFDGATSTFDRVVALTIQSCYWETPVAGNAIELGGSGNNVLRTVEISGCYFNRIRYAIFCKNSVLSLKVRPNYYGGPVYCALYYVSSEAAGFEYESGYNTLPFVAKEVHTGYGQVSTSQLTFGGISISKDFLNKGVQLAPSKGATTNWYPNGSTLAGEIQITSASGRFLTNPSLNISGMQSGSAFTCSTLSDCYLFNGGDRITGGGGASFVRYVDYDLGVVYVDGSFSGATTISHAASAVFRTIKPFVSAAPTTGSWIVGDRVYFNGPAVNGFVGWICTASGSPGTWTPFGKIGVDIGKSTSGTTAGRPLVATIGYEYFDTTIGKPIWWKGAGWVDAMGTTV